MNISVESNVKEVLSEFDRISNLSIPFAIKEGINDTFFQMRQELPGVVESEFDKPVAFTKSPYAWDVEKAQKYALVGMIKMKPLQAEYMRFQVYGGTEYPKKRGIPVPTAGGKMKASHGGLKKTWKAALNDKMYFSGKPKGAKWASSPAGVWRRTATKVSKKTGRRTKGRLRLELSWESATHYQERWDFHAYATKYFQARFSDNFRKRLQEQLARRG